MRNAVGEERFIVTHSLYTQSSYSGFSYTHTTVIVNKLRKRRPEEHCKCAPDAAAGNQKKKRKARFRVHQRIQSGCRAPFRPWRETPRARDEYV